MVVDINKHALRVRDRLIKTLIKLTEEHEEKIKHLEYCIKSNKDVLEKLKNENDEGVYDYELIR